MAALALPAGWLRSRLRGEPGFAVSLAAHVIILLGLILLRRQPPPPEADEAVAVEVVSQEAFEAETGVARPASGPSLGPSGPGLPGATPPPSPLPAPSAPLPAEPPPQPPPAASGPVRASRLYSADILAAPKSRRAREKLARVEMTTRVEQICGIEAMAQVSALRSDMKPSRVVAYATADVRMTGDVLTAPGAALLSDHRWYRLSFRCTIPLAVQRVTAFEFALGPEIPRREWEAHDLTDQGEMDD